MLSLSLSVTFWSSAVRALLIVVCSVVASASGHLHVHTFMGGVGGEVELQAVDRLKHSACVLGMAIGVVRPSRRAPFGGVGIAKELRQALLRVRDEDLRWIVRRVVGRVRRFSQHLAGAKGGLRRAGASSPGAPRPPCFVSALSPPRGCGAPSLYHRPVRKGGRVYQVGHWKPYFLVLRVGGGPGHRSVSKIAEECLSEAGHVFEWVKIAAGWWVPPRRTLSPM